VNSHGTFRVLDQCRNHGCSVSYISGYVYGNAQRLPIDETAPVSANNPYAFSKLMGEEACRFYSSTFGVQTTILRLFNIYGPGQSSRFLIPHIVKQVIEDPDIRVMDLEPRRDYVFISDTIDSILASVRASSGMAFNVGSGISYSVEDVIRIAMRQAGVEKPYHAAGQPRTNEIRDVIADTTLIRSACGWAPGVTFEDGIGRIIQSHRAS